MSEASSKHEDTMKQGALFDADNVEVISIDDIAFSLNVSSASVRNWIRTGYLQKVTRNLLCSGCSGGSPRQVICYQGHKVFLSH